MPRRRGAFPLAGSPTDWVYAGGPRGRNNTHLNYWNLLTNNSPLLEPKEACACGRAFGNIDYHYYVRHKTEGTLAQVGTCCFQHLPNSQRKRTCETCGANHASLTVNKCTDCREDGEQVLNQRERARRHAEAWFGTAAQEASLDFEQIELRTEHLGFLARSAFVGAANHISWTASCRSGDEDTMFVNMFYDRSIQATLYYSLETDKLLRYRAQGGPAIAAHIERHFETLDTVLHLIVELSRAANEGLM